MRVIRCLIFITALFPMLVWSGDLSDAAGKPFAKRVGQTREPVKIVDSVQMSGGFGTITFNRELDGVRRTTNPSGSAFVFAFFTQRTIDTSATPPVYSYKTIKNSQNQITGIRVVSSDANDSARVDVYVIVK